jgi:hypothetical protein
MSETTHNELKPNNTDPLTPAEQQIKLGAFAELARWMLSLAPELVQQSTVDAQAVADAEVA